MKIELVTGQMWRIGTGFIRVVKVGKLLVEYKVMQDLDHKVAPLSLVSQKEFCIMLKAKKASLIALTPSGKLVADKGAVAKKPVASTPSVAAKKPKAKASTSSKAKGSVKTGAIKSSSKVKSE